MSYSSQILFVWVLLTVLLTVIYYLFNTVTYEMPIIDTSLNIPINNNVPPSFLNFNDSTDIFDSVRT